MKGEGAGGRSGVLGRNKAQKSKLREFLGNDMITVLKAPIV